MTGQRKGRRKKNDSEGILYLLLIVAFLTWLLKFCNSAGKLVGLSGIASLLGVCAFYLFRINEPNYDFSVLNQAATFAGVLYLSAFLHRPYKRVD